MVEAVTTENPSLRYLAGKDIESSIRYLLLREYKTCSRSNGPNADDDVMNMMNQGSNGIGMPFNPMMMNGMNMANMDKLMQWAMFSSMNQKSERERQKQEQNAQYTVMHKMVRSSIGDKRPMDPYGMYSAASGMGGMMGPSTAVGYTMSRVPR